VAGETKGEQLNVHTDFPLLQRIALPITVGAARHPDIKIQGIRIICLLDVLLDAGTQVGGWTTREIDEAVLATFTSLRTPTVSTNFATSAQAQGTRTSQA
jgi:hypothetical protein